jgi:hypothetical protein
VNGKGDSPRPKSVTPAEYADAWERTFGDPREAMRQQHLAEAKAVITSHPCPQCAHSWPCSCSPDAVAPPHPSASKPDAPPPSTSSAPIP